MIKISNWKNYNIRVEIRDTNKDIQLLIFADDELAFATRKKTLYIRDYKYQTLKLNKYYLPIFVDDIQTKVQFKDPKEKIRYMNFCSNFKRKICLQIQDEVRWLFSDYGKKSKETA